MTQFSVTVLCHSGNDCAPSVAVYLLLWPGSPAVGSDANQMCALAGEINTIQGNLNWVSSREHSLKAPVWHGREEELLPLCNYQESDSANLDHLAEFLISSGTEACQSLMALVPEAFNNHPDLTKFYPKVTHGVSRDASPPVLA